MAKLIIDETTRTKLNKKLQTFGLSISGASKEPGGRWWITINKGCSATYSGTEVAQTIMKELNVSEIVLDGKPITSVA